MLSWAGPLCLDAAKDVEHVHPVTGQVVGAYKIETMIYKLVPTY